MKSSVLISLLFLITACHREEIDVPITADFSYEIIDNDYSIPVKIAFINKSNGAQIYTWTFEGGSPETYTQKDPGYIIFTKPGSIKVKLVAGIDGEFKEKEITILLDSVVKADFDIAPVVNNYGPTEFTITNKSGGATQFNWSFANGSPASSTEKEPNVNFANPGEYEVKLLVSNERGEKNSVTKTVKVLAALTANFDITPSFDDDDYEAPLTAVLQNHTTNATTHKWSSIGGTINNNADSIPSITFSNPGTYSVTYEATNGKQTETISKSITVKPNSGLRHFTNVHLGINTAHSTIGSFFSTSLRKVFKQSEVDATNGNKIDLVFFGLSQSFNFNLFASPDSAGSWTFAPIPGAAHTKFINKQESCGCSASFDATDFDSAVTGSVFDGLNITATAGGSGEFNNNLLPRIVLFQNSAGKKGAIKIKQFAEAGQQSYIVCDIKMQKGPL